MLLDLAQAGLVVSQTGSMGGSRLATDPAKTTLLDIYQALECGGVFSLHRQPPSRDCPVGVNIETVLGDVLQEVDSAVELVLKNITIDDVVQRLKPCGTLNNVKNSRLGKSLGKSNGRLNGKAAKVLRTA
jgi:DNA-binding IscR family transcriptional regulator